MAGTLMADAGTTTTEVAVAEALAEVAIVTVLQEVVVREEENLLAAAEATQGAQARVQVQADVLQEEVILLLQEREGQEEAKNYFI